MSGSLARHFAALVLGGAALFAAAQNPPAPKPQTGTGLIAGKVVEAGSQTPVAEAVVTLFGPNNPNVPNLGDRRRVMVDGQGRFVFTGLAAGSYRLISDQFGYMLGVYGALRPSTDALPIDLADGQRVIDATIPMWRMVSIAGRVVDEAGEPVVGVIVRPLLRSIRRGQVELTPWIEGSQRSFVTDDRGMFRAALLPPGDYAIAVPSTVSTFPADVLRDILTSKVDLGVSETAPLGTARNLQIGNHVLATSSFAPVPPAKDGRPVTVYETTLFPGVTAASEADVLSLGAGENRSGVDIRLVAKPAVSVSGEISGPDGPLPLTTFRLVRTGGIPAAEASGFEVATGITNARGQFTLLGVPRGSYVIRVRVSKPVLGARLSADHLLTVGDADVTDVAVTARRAATVSGRVEMRGTKPIAFESLMLAIESADSAVESRVGRDGKFAVDLLPGRYLVLVHIGASVCTSTSGGKTISDDLLDVRDENISDVLIVCGGDTPTRISGTVRDDRGQLDPKARVVVFSTEKHFWSGPDYRRRRHAFQRTTPAGTFEISNLPPGDYFVAAIPEVVASDWELPAVRNQLIPLATRVTVGAAETRAVDLRTVVIR